MSSKLNTEKIEQADEYDGWVRPPHKERGCFYKKENWSEDKTYKYFQGPIDKVLWPLTKLLLLIFLQVYLYKHDVSPAVMVIAALFIQLTYQHVVATLFGFNVMPAMDQACFISSSKSNINYCSATLIDGNFTTDNLEEFYYQNLLKRFPKMQ
jgi:hypothetical protein